MKFPQGFKAMYAGYLEQVALERLGSDPIPENWRGMDDPRANITNDDLANANSRCMAFGRVISDAFQKYTGHELNEAMWVSAGMILAMRDCGNDVVDFVDRVEYEEGFTLETANLMDDLLSDFLSSAKAAQIQKM